MDTLLHGKIGVILGKELKDRGFNRLSNGYFIYGNILPDISPRYRFSMHEKKGNWQDVVNIINTVSDNSKMLSIKDISIKLGIMTHFLCDFFTFPHNELFKGNIIKHEIYEQIQRNMLWKKLDDYWERYREEINVSINSIDNLLSYIEDMHSIYMNNTSNMERDMLFASISIRVVSYSILSIRDRANKKSYGTNIITSDAY